MSMSERRRRDGDGSHEELLQERLRILLNRLGWSYAVLWTLNPQTRVLEWKRGHFQMDAWAGTPTSQPKLVYAQQFCTAYASCTFAPGAGFVGRAFHEARHIWLTGDIIRQNAGSLQQAQFLRDANIKTIMCIPRLESVLELGTTNSVEEDFGLIDRIQQVLSHDLLSLVPDDNNDDDEADVSGFVEYDQAVTLTKSSPAGLFNQAPGLSTLSWPPPKPFEAATSTLSLPVGALDRSCFQSVFVDHLNGWRFKVITLNPALGLSNKEEEFARENILVAQTESHACESDLRSDVFMHEQGTQQPTIAAAWRLASKAGGYPSTGLIADQSRSHGLMISRVDTSQYGSCTDSFGSSSAATGTPSTSKRSSQGDNHPSPARNPLASASASSPDQLHCQPYLVSAPFLGSSQPDRASSSGRRLHGLHHYEAELAFPKQSTNDIGARAALNLPQLRRTTTSCGYHPGDQYGILTEVSLSEMRKTQSDQELQVQATAGGIQQQQQQQQQQPQKNPASISSLQKQHKFLFPVEVDVPAPSVFENPGCSSHQSEFMLSHLDSKKQQGSRLLRRHSLTAMDVLMELDILAQGQAADQAGDHPTTDQAGSNVISSEFLNEDFRLFDQLAHEEVCVKMNMPRLRGPSRASCSRGSGALQGTRGDAALTHMLAERRRRLKQKETFTTLRRLVPLISKADKASTLVDTIAYLKNLQSVIVHMETNKEAMDQRCKNLAKKCVELEIQNRELVAMLPTMGKLDRQHIYENVTWQIKTS